MESVTSGREHPDLVGVGSEMRGEWRAEQEAATADAAEQWRHSRTLQDWMEERMHAGDRIAVTIGAQRFAGLVEETGEDLVALRCTFGRVDIHLTPGLPLSIEIHDHATSGGDRARARRTFHDALLARDGNNDVTVGTMHDLDGLDGTMHVGRDFVSVIARLGAETVIPLQYVTWVSARRA
jgi:hypothetical protein